MTNEVAVLFMVPTNGAFEPLPALVQAVPRVGEYVVLVDDLPAAAPEEGRVFYVREVRHAMRRTPVGSGEVLVPARVTVMLGY